MTRNSSRRSAHFWRLLTTCAPRAEAPRALLPSVPIILATGRVDQTAMDLASAFPRVTLLAKPFNMEELRSELAKANGH